jgi:hypothetical protein
MGGQAESPTPPATETDVARAIASGTLPSPQRAGNSMLWALRVSGCGLAERPALKEFAIRDPAVFLSDEMTRRCTGLPITLGHPPGGVLNSNEFAYRSVGVTVYCYVHNGALWCVGRILDSDTNAALREGLLSTSPSAVFRPTDIASAIDLGGGQKLIAEGNPAAIDHLALVDAGTWDRGHQRGVRADNIEGETMTDQTDTPPDPAADVLQKILSCLTDTSGRLDAMGSRLDAVCAKVDSMQSAKAEGERDPGMPPDAPRMVAADSAKPATKTLEQERAENQERVQAQVRADQACVAFGERAPPPMQGETPLAYRKRLLRPYRKYSPDYKEIDVDTVNDAAMFAVIEQRVYADAIKAAENCEHLADDGPHPVIRTDETGRRIIEWRGRHTFIHALKPPLMRAQFRHPRFRDDQAG